MGTKIEICILLFFGFILLSMGAHAQEKAAPKAGEGISTFLLRHNRAPKKYYDDFIQLNKKKLGKKNVLQTGVTYLIPPVKVTSPSKSEASDEPDTGQSGKRGKGTVHQPLFGRGMASVPVTSNRLKGACFYVVSGHGGPDPGAVGKVGKYTLHEDEYAYDIALRLARSLMGEGAEVRIIIQDAVDGIRDEAYLTNSKRETCMGEAIPLNQVRRLQQRCDKINSHYRKDRKNFAYCRSIFIHVDSRSVRKQTDVFFYYSAKKADGKRLAYTMKNMFESKYDMHQPNRGFSGTVSGRNLYVLTHGTPAAVFVELGNIQNAFDQKRLVMSSNRQALAKWLTEGFLKDFKERR